MPFSYNLTTASAGQTQVNVTFPYLSKADVHVTLNGALVSDAALVWASPTLITLPAAQSAGVAIKVYRLTPSGVVIYQAQVGPIDHRQVNNSALQLLYVAQEATDQAADSLTLANTNVGIVQASQTAAAGSATAAASSATAAAGSASGAAGSATGASGSATAAAASATAANTSKVNAGTSETNAAASATAAASSATAANTSKLNAATSETNASGSATAAASSATAANTSKNNAATSETNSAASATAAAGSATAANTSKNNAATSETNAAGSATAAAASATAANTSKNNAATSETNAAASATAANTSKVNAGTSETNAAASAATATTKASNAATSETNAAGSATAAASSATAANTSKVNAGTSETNAAASAAAAAASAGSMTSTEVQTVNAGAVTSIGDTDVLAHVQTAGPTLKKITWANVKATLWTAWGALIAGGTNKAAPVAADKIAIADSAATNATKYVTMTQMWTAYFKGQADGLYSLLGHTHTFASLTSIPTTLAGYGITDGITTSGGSTSGEIKSTFADNWRIKQGGYGAFWKNDGTNLYLLLTNAADADGTYNSLRPFTVALSSGAVTFGPAATFGSTVTSTGTLNGQGGTYDNGTRVYSANNPPPAVVVSHNAVGGYCFVKYDIGTGASIAPGTSVAGSALVPAAYYHDTAADVTLHPQGTFGSALSGTWSFRGHVAAGATTTTDCYTLAERIA